MMMSMYMGGMGAPACPVTANDPTAKLLTKRVRTDFLIQFVWQPPAPDAKPEEREEVEKKLREAEADQKNKGAVAIPEDTMAKEAEAAAKKKMDALAKAAEAQAKAAQNAAGEPRPPPRRPPRPPRAPHPQVSSGCRPPAPRPASPAGAARPPRPTPNTSPDRGPPRPCLPPKKRATSTPPSR